MNQELAVLFAKRFIQRRDVKAVQYSSGAYVPDRSAGFAMEDLFDHLDGRATYGHYLLDQTSHCRMFAFDIDLRKTGSYVPMTPYADGMTEEQWIAQNQPIMLGNPDDRSDNSLREAWLDRAHPARPWIKTQMGMLARKFVSAIQTELNIPCAASYSGAKGVHVYGFTGPLPAEQVRAAATYVIESMDDWEIERGHHLYKHKLTDPFMGYPNFSVEVFPKQDSLGDGEDSLGNLMRLPLGRNLKSQDPTFFLDLTTAPGDMRPHSNPVALLESGNPYA